MNKTFNCVEAMRHLLEGKRIRSLDWSKNEFIFLSKENVILDEKGCVFDVYFSHTNRYEFFESPKTFGDVPYGETFRFKDGSGPAIKVKTPHGNAIVNSKDEYNTYTAIIFRENETVIYPV